LVPAVTGWQMEEEEEQEEEEEVKAGVAPC
jgi:hypothetical protein